MTKPVAVFRSEVIEDSRHTVRLDENSHLVLFPSFSRYITSSNLILVSCNLVVVGRIPSRSLHFILASGRHQYCFFPSLSPHRRYQPHGQRRHLEVATGRDRVYGWLSVDYHVSGVSRPGRVGHSDPQRPSTGSIWRPIPRTTGGVGFCPLDRAVGVNPRFSLLYRMRLVVLVPQHQTAMYETCN
jgi:hypothetical protein